MDSSGSLERTSALRFALPTPSRQADAEDPDDTAEHLDRPEQLETRDRPERSDRPERNERNERNDRPDSGTRARGDRSVPGTREEGQIVLLIEDSPEVVEAVTYCLHGAGYQTQVATDVEAAVEKVKSRAVSLVMLNWSLLLRIGGGTLIAQLRQATPRSRLPMVVISDEVADLNEAISLGIEDYLLDPFQLADLLQVVDEYCG